MIQPPYINLTALILQPLLKIIEGTDPKNYVFQTIKDGNKTHLLRIDRDILMIKER